MNPQAVPKLEFTYDQMQEVQQKELFNKGKKLYEYQSKKLKKSLRNSSDQKLFQKLVNSGTIMDKISAFSLGIKDDFKSSLMLLHNLLSIASLKSREKSLKALFTLKDLFLHIILPQGVAIHFDQGEGDEVNRYFWHCIRNMVSKFCELVIKMSQDVLPYIRKQAILIMIEFHSAYPLLTQDFIPELVNKFGDLDKSVISLATKKLTAEVSRKPALTYAFIKQVYGFMYRPNLPQQAQQYSLNFLNSINLAHQEPGTLGYLLKVFFIFFKKLIAVPDAEIKAAKLYTQILKGINRTFPYGQRFLGQLRELYQENEKQIFTTIATSSNLKIKIQTLYFVYQVQEKLNDHFYRSLYELLLFKDLDQTKLGELLFDLLFMSIKSDESLPRQKAFVKRLLQVALHTNLAFTITALVCVQKLTIEQKALLDPIQTEGAYNPFKREPQFSNANEISELDAFLQHFHPKVVKIAQSILNREEEIHQKLNPLLEYSQSAFLAKFAEAKNRTLNRISNLSNSVIDQEDYLLKYNAQREHDKELKQMSKPGRQGSELDEEEDEFADRLFQEELDRNDVDEDEDIDYGSYGESSDGEEVMTEKFGEEKKKRSLLRKKIEKRWRLLRSK